MLEGTQSGKWIEKIAGNGRIILTSIENNGEITTPPQFRILVQDSMVTISWSEITNTYGYRLFYAPYPYYSVSDIGEIDMGKQREITFYGKGFAFYGAVKAYNRNGFSELSNIEFFDLR